MPNMIDSTLVASAYNINGGGSGSRSMVKLSNGWLVTVMAEPNNVNTYFYVSKDNGLTWTNQFYFNAVSGTTPQMFLHQPSLASNGTDIFVLFHLLVSSDSKYRTTCLKFDVLTTSGRVGGQNAIDTVVSNDVGGTSLMVNDAGTEIHATWSVKNAHFANNFNIKYAKGSILPDGSVAWGSALQITSSNANGFNNKYPSLIIYKDNPIIFSEYNNANQTDGGAIYCHRYDGSKWISNFKVFGTTAFQTFPSAIFIPPNISNLPNGRIELFWQGIDRSFGNVLNSYSDDGGVTWSSMVNLTNSSTAAQNRPQATYDRNGKVFVMWSSISSGSTFARINMLTKSNGIWGEIQLLSNNTAFNAVTPSLLIEPTLDINIPLFVYSSDKMYFQGSWSTFYNTVKSGNIGQIVDRTNILNYVVSSNQTIPTIIEKVNGVVVGSKTTTNGQNITVSLTQEQWDSLKFGGYESPVGGLNTLEVEIGDEKWTYTFAKGVKEDADLVTSLKGLLDAQNTHLPASKAKLATAIRKQGGNAFNDSSFSSMADVINTLPVPTLASLGGVRWASGEAVSNGTSVAFWHPNGNTIARYSLVVGGLTFKARVILVYAKSNNDFAVYFPEWLFTGGNNNIKIMHSSYSVTSTVSTTVYSLAGDMGNQAVSNTGFNMPTAMANNTYKWIAFE